VGTQQHWVTSWKLSENPVALADWMETQWEPSSTDTASAGEL